MKEPSGEGCAEIEVRRSRFIARARKLVRPGDARAAVERERAAQPGCSHVAHAFVLGSDCGLQGMSDDREPKGTAGRPVLEVLKGSGVTNILVTVTRFFGGTKLGTGGLSRAYAAAAAAALARLPVVPLVTMRSFVSELPYDLYDPIARILLELGGRIERCDFTTQVAIAGSLPEDGVRAFLDRVRSLSGGRCAVRLEQGNAPA